MKPFSTPRRIQRVRREIKQRDVVVARIEALGSGFVSITFKGDSLADFASDSFDDHIKFIFSNSAGEQIRRDYTPRHFEPGSGELTLEFALHGDGEAVNWARSAQVGQHAVIGGPRGSMVIPMDYDWQLLAGDATALPAIRRRLEELPPETKSIVRVCLGGADEHDDFASDALLDVDWVKTPQELLSSLRQLQLPPGDGFVWFAGESALTAEVRRIMVEEKSLPKESMKISAYWKQGTSGFHEPHESQEARGTPIPASPK